MNSETLSFQQRSRDCSDHLLERRMLDAECLGSGLLHFRVGVGRSGLEIIKGKYGYGTYALIITGQKSFRSRA